MLGSASETDDAVQETFIKAWRAAASFGGRSSVRTWLFRIAHHVCIDMYRSPQRRARPMDLAPPTPAAEAVLGSQPSSHGFVDPMPDDRALDLAGDPGEIVARRETIRLAFVAALQLLPPRQRSALILCDVLRWPASDAAIVFDTSTASINSALQRARATLAATDHEQLDPTADPAHAELLDRYVDAFERYDVTALIALMRSDAVLTMPPLGLWLQGVDQLHPWFLGPGAGCRGSKLLPIALNGTAGFASYRRARGGRWEPFALQVIEVASGQIVGHHNFVTPDRFVELGLPPVLETSSPPMLTGQVRSRDGRTASPHHHSSPRTW